MKLHRSPWVLLAAAALLGTIATSAQAQFFFYSPRGPFVRNPYYAPNYSYSYNPSGYNPSGYNPYVAPYPAYGILPGPVMLAPWQFSGDQGYEVRNRPSNVATPARKQSDLYSTAPQKPPVDRSAEIRRVRFEINVPRENAAVLIDGTETKQTGLSRVYLTPPMAEDRLFTSEFEVRWTDEQGKTQSARKTFEFVAGETVRHAFK